MCKQLINMMYHRSLAISLGKSAPKHYITETLLFSLCRVSAARRQLLRDIKDLFKGGSYEETK